ncbi:MULTISPECIES: XTP/dITP diphosphatase [Saccharibacillus]|uniref:dITP/XTP pyrophosphatase n=1 Tax=Saccharibacillus brassicae TaxID=2583377 RepID=A0A4Y6UTA2_SACBS|nr:MULTISPECIES: XTP/dITP diphosphatase [Saccharibacillus]MWJ31467.1 XTP/dITP diphosphatase [Saccharibacillus sp. WB 17]QDH20294.1 XTP/dITP diphosphatase [Saccharibacillus brassicae]
MSEAGSGNGREIIVMATRNMGKVREFRHALEPLGKEVRSLHEYPEAPEVVEDGRTFAENAFKKAKEIGDFLNLPVISDDSGLCVEMLDGAPGIHSARYAGEHGNDAANNAKLMDELMRRRLGDDTEQPLLSPAKFVCALAMYDPATGRTLESEGQVEGWITSETAGAGGFGYDPLFFVPQYERTMAELSVEEKQRISHRGAALQELLKKLNG